MPELIDVSTDSGYSMSVKMAGSTYYTWAEYRYTQGQYLLLVKVMVVLILVVGWFIPMVLNLVTSFVFFIGSISPDYRFFGKQYLSQV